MHHFCPDTPVIVVGTKTDLRTNEITISEQSYLEQQQVLSSDGRRVATRIAAVAYHECSAKNSDGVRELFETATRAAVARKCKKRRHRVCKML